MQQYPDGRSAEFRQEFLRGLKAINRELEEQSEVEAFESRVAEYERAFQQQLHAQRASSGAATETLDGVWVAEQVLSAGRPVPKE